MKIGFIGTGNMGGAILKGYADSENASGNEIFICNRTDEKSRKIAYEIAKNCRVCSSNKELADAADVIIIGVKPDNVADVLKHIAPAEDKIIISMAAGISIDAMENILNTAAKGSGEKAKIIRIMPNTPAQVGEAMTSMSRNSNVTDDDMSKIKDIFDSVGMCEEVNEDMIDCVIGVSGSSPAYTYMYIEALAQAAADNGMAPDKARRFAAQAVLGAAKMALKNRESLEQLRVNVCSPGGTTIEAVNKLFENGFMDDVKEGMQAAINRSKEMTGK